MRPLFIYDFASDPFPSFYRRKIFFSFFISVGVPHIPNVVFPPHIPDALNPLVDILGVELGEVGNAGKQDPGIGPRISKQLFTIPGSC
jgi:hypothetical protein